MVELKALPTYGQDDQLLLGKRVFYSLFWISNPYLRVFPHCNLIVKIDAIWLYKKYIQIFLIAVAQDNNQNILLIAFVIVDKKYM